MKTKVFKVIVTYKPQVEFTEESVREMFAECLEDGVVWVWECESRV